MQQNKLLFEDLCNINSGYLASPACMDLLKEVTDFDEWIITRDNPAWDEYRIETDIYPEFLTTLVHLGIAFIWEYDLTEDFQYVAYNFPTEDKPMNYGQFRTGERGKKLPRFTKKFLKETESTSAANELLYKLGHANGSNKLACERSGSTGTVES